MADGLLSVFPAADACPADLCVVGKLLTVPAFCLPVSAEEGSSAPVQKQGVVVQNILHRDAVKGGELVRKFGREAAVKCARFPDPDRAIPPCPPWQQPLFAAGQDHSGTNADGPMGSGCRRKNGTYGRTPAPLRWCGGLPKLPVRCIEGLDHDPHMTPSEVEKRNRSLGSKKIYFDVDASLRERGGSSFPSQSALGRG